MVEPQREPGDLSGLLRDYLDDANQALLSGNHIEAAEIIAAMELISSRCPTLAACDQMVDRLLEMAHDLKRRIGETRRQQVRCNCGNSAVTVRSGAKMCAHCALEDERHLIRAKYFWNESEMNRELYDIIEGIRSACCQYANEDYKILSAISDMIRMTRGNAACEDPLPYLTSIKDRLWEGAPA